MSCNRISLFIHALINSFAWRYLLLSSPFGSSMWQILYSDELYSCSFCSSLMTSYGGAITALISTFSSLYVNPLSGLKIEILISFYFSSKICFWITKISSIDSVDNSINLFKRSLEKLFCSLVACISTMSLFSFITILQSASIYESSS